MNNHPGILRDEAHSHHVGERRSGGDGSRRSPQPLGDPEHPLELWSQRSAGATLPPQNSPDDTDGSEDGDEPPPRLLVGRGVPAGSGERRAPALVPLSCCVVVDGLLKIALAEAEDRAGDPDGAMTILDDALATSDHLGFRAFEAELHRARGEILLKRDPANPRPRKTPS